MAYNEHLTIRIREALAHLPGVVEKRMFRGVTFMLNGKMCISVGNDEIMVRVNPELHDTLAEKNGCRPMIHSGKTMKGFLFIHELSIRSKKDFDYWLNLALDFNKNAKASPKRKKK